MLVVVSNVDANVRFFLLRWQEKSVFFVKNVRFSVD